MQTERIQLQIQAVAVAMVASHRLLGRLLAMLRPLRHSEESNRPASEACKVRYQRIVDLLLQINQVGR
jgi:hypothetical protein